MTPSEGPATTPVRTTCAGCGCCVAWRLGLRAPYRVLEGALRRLVHLGHGLAAILAFIGVKLTLHWASLQWPSVPEIPTWSPSAW